jgi:hypothetical protein
MIIPLTAIAVLVIVLYWRTLFFSIVIDDIRQLEGKTFRDERFKTYFKWNDPFRSLIDWVTTRLYGAGTFPFWKKCACQGHQNGNVCQRCRGKGYSNEFNLILEHGFTILLNIAISCLIYLSFGKTQVSFIAAILYAANATNNQTSIWMNGRRYAINIILMLCLILTGPWGLPIYLATPIFQISAVFSPVLWGGLWWLLVPALVGLNFNRIRNFYNNRMAAIVNDDMRSFTPKRITVCIRTLGFYFGKMIAPGKVLMIYPFLDCWGMTKEGNKKAYSFDMYFWGGLFAIISGAAGLAYFQGAERCWWAFMYLSTIQWCNILTSNQTAADRYASLPNVFMMYFVSKIINIAFGIYALPAAALLLGYYMSNLNVTLTMFKDITTFYNYHSFYYPDNVTIRKFEVNWKLKAKDPLGAWELLKVGLAYSPNDFTLLYQAGVVMQIIGEPTESEKYFERAEANHYQQQEPLWTENIKKLRSQNKPKEQNRIINPNDHGIVDFARRKR